MIPVIVIAAVVILLGYVAIRKIQKSLQPPLRVHLTPCSPNKSHAQSVASFRDDLESRGFEEIGTFRVAPIRGLMLTAFTQRYQSVLAVIYNHPFGGVFFDVVSVTEPDQSLTVTSAPVGEELDQPPGDAKIFDKELTLLHAYDMLLSKRPEGPYRAIDADNFVEEFQSAYAREMDWRLARGGVTKDEVRRSAAAMGITSEKQIGQSNEKLQAQYQSMNRQFPCENDPSGMCPYEHDGLPDHRVRGMPMSSRDKRSCPKYHHICPTFSEAMSLSDEDLHIRAAIHRLAEVQVRIRRGDLEKDSPEYVRLKLEADNMRRRFPKDRYPQYY